MHRRRLLEQPLVAAVLAAWGSWRRQWTVCMPAVFVGAWLFLPAGLLAPVYDRVVAFVNYVEPRNLAMTWLLVDAAAVGCLVALWAGWSRAAWFWRLSALAGVPAALSLVKANEPIAMALAVLPVIAAAAWWLRRIRDRRNASAAASPASGEAKFRWQIRDGLLLFVPVGLIALAVRSLVAGPLYIQWGHFATLAAALVLLAIAAAAAGAASSWLRRLGSLIIGIALIAGITTVFIARDNDVLGLAYFFEQNYIQHVGPGLFLMAIAGIPAMIGLMCGIDAWRQRAAARNQSTLLPTALLIASWIALGTPLLMVGLLMLPPTFTIERLPRSPTYERLVAAGERIRPLVPAGRPAAKLKPEIDAVAEILQEPGHVWIDVDTFAARELARQYDLSFDALFHIVYGLEVEIARAEAHGDYSESARLGVLQLRLAQVMSKGGMMIHWGIAKNAESRGRAAIESAAPHLDAGELSELLAAVQEHEHSRGTLDSMLAYHDYWNWVAFGWRERFFQAARKLTGDRNVWLTLGEDRLRNLRQTELASLRLLEARLAIELYRREGDRFLLYSTWSDGKDNGGKFLTEMNQATDFGSNVGYDLDPGFDRRGNPWPRNDPLIMGTTPKPTSPIGAPAATTDGD